MSVFSVCGQTLSWDGQAVSWDTGDTKRSLYLNSEATDPLLYESKSALSGFFARKYRVTAGSSNLAFVASKVRDLCVDVWQVIFGPQVSTFYKVTSAVGLVLTGVLLGPVPLVASMIDLYVSTVWWYAPGPCASTCYPAGMAALAHIGIGACAWVPSVIVMTAVESLCRAILCGVSPVASDAACEPLPEQDAISLMKHPRIGLAISIYACIGAPLIEEYLFRGKLRAYFVAKEPVTIKRTFTKLREWLRPPAAEPVLSWARLQTIVKTSVCFGAAHYSQPQGLTNYPIVAVTTVMGIACAILREQTGTLWAPTALHSLHNIIVTLRIHHILP